MESSATRGGREGNDWPQKKRGEEAEKERYRLVRLTGHVESNELRASDDGGSFVLCRLYQPHPVDNKSVMIIRYWGVVDR